MNKSAESLLKEKDNYTAAPGRKKNLNDLSIKLKKKFKKETVPIIIYGILMSLTFSLAMIVFSYQLSVS